VRRGAACRRHAPSRTAHGARLLAVLLVGMALSACAPTEELILASTTSTFDSGLLDVLLPAFGEEHDDIRVKLVAVGSGEAMALGRRRDADVLLVHSPEDEEEFMRTGHGRRRLPVMHNDYIIVGPGADPARVRSALDVRDALERIARQRAPFISRGDSSGTHRKEMRLWQAAGVADPPRMQVGQGMGEALTITSERVGYTLTDRGTFLALRQSLDLEILHEGDDALLNPYSVITVRGSRHEAEADIFTEWLVSPAAQERIRTFADPRSGEPLFFPARPR
jgi:tungstate transport system substrate-binding protein